MYRVPNGEDLWYEDLKDLEYVYPKDVQYESKNTFNEQITTKKGVQYNIVIGLGSNAFIPMYIQSIGKLSFVWIGCFVMSVIVWVFAKVNAYMKLRY